ncbi:MAG: hypothetical protein JXI43_05420 [Tissierellales bacterium]|nr:hypothetical protein [Tissierellales bacterium]
MITLGRLLIFTSLLFLLIISSVNVLMAEKSDSDKYTIINDKEYFFKVPLPSNWKIKRSKDFSSALRVSAESPDGKHIVAIYAFKENSDIDLEKLAGADQRMFSNLGDVTNSSKLKKHIFWTQAISKIYSKNRKGFETTGYFTTDGTYGYVILAYSSSGDFTVGKKVAESFKCNVPFFTNLQNRLKGGVAVILVFAVPIGLGFLGYTTRNYSWGMALCIIFPVVAGIALLYDGFILWKAFLAALIILVLMFAGRYGIVMYTES